MINSILHGCCFDWLEKLEPGSVDLILADLPYGATRNYWDKPLDLNRLWPLYWRALKDNGAVVLTATNPYAALLITSQIQNFRYDWVWNKVFGRGHLNAKKQPLRSHELVLVFYRKPPTYNPQMDQGEPYKRPPQSKTSSNTGHYELIASSSPDGLRYPKTIVTFSNADQRDKINPTQKPVDLFRYYIRTYTNPGDIVLDNVAGSCTTAIAALEEGRRYICIESREDQVKAAQARIAKWRKERGL